MFFFLLVLHLFNLIANLNLQSHKQHMQSTFHGRPGVYVPLISLKGVYCYQGMTHCLSWPLFTHQGLFTGLWEDSSICRSSCIKLFVAPESCTINNRHQLHMKSRSLKIWRRGVKRKSVYPTSVICFSSLLEARCHRCTVGNVGMRF